MNDETHTFDEYNGYLVGGGWFWNLQLGIVCVLLYMIKITPIYFSSKLDFRALISNRLNRSSWKLHL